MDEHKEHISIQYLAGVISAYALVLSLSYNFAYFFKLDSRLLYLLGLQDHLTSALTWLLISVVPFAIMFFIVHPIRIWYLKKYNMPDGSPIHFILGAPVAIITIWIYEKPTLLVMSLMFVCVGWAAFMPMLYNRLQFFGVSKTDKWFIIILPLFLCLSVIGGLEAAKKDINSTNYHKVKANNISYEGIIVRSLDKGIILKNENEYIFLTWNKISTITKSINTKSDHIMQTPQSIVPYPE